MKGFEERAKRVVSCRADSRFPCGISVSFVASKSAEAKEDGPDGDGAEHRLRDAATTVSHACRADAGATGGAGGSQRPRHHCARTRCESNAPARYLPPACR